MRIVADANVLLSAVIGGKALRVLRHPGIEEILVTATVLDEIHEYAVVLARKKRLAVDTVLTALVTLPVTVIDHGTYLPSIKAAEHRIGRRDPDDVETLALALHSGLPVWSNDSDFDGVGVVWHTTAELLAVLERG